MQFQFVASLLAMSALISSTLGESHTIHFTNKCGKGTPTLLQNGVILSTGGDYTHDGPIISAIAYHTYASQQPGGCGLNGESCTLIETTLKNPTTAGSGSSTDISLIPPHTFSVTSGFGPNCTDANCPDAFHDPSQTWVQVACQTDNVDLAITFCD
ncbi:glycopeptide [Dichomitus squalens LYAD-421 SS1]|uniref:Glycopeptide n=1 Tax=Dichomitus squalens (strain LYAD-421) TaxID=732165 RepID=R7ST26_DICSQ|nr:glycopeptide [Dichomitus squalens LYAD-421 SS1]EJF59181.1 glycopeptide [Dichomitus squalens LYAD-421 SS1]